MTFPWLYSLPWKNLLRVVARKQNPGGIKEKKKKDGVMQCVEFGLSSKRFLIPSPLVTICVTSDKFNYFSKPQFLHG